MFASLGPLDSSGFHGDRWLLKNNQSFWRPWCIYVCGIWLGESSVIPAVVDYSFSFIVVLRPPGSPKTIHAQLADYGKLTDLRWSHGKESDGLLRFSIRTENRSSHSDRPLDCFRVQNGAIVLCFSPCGSSQAGFLGGRSSSEKHRLEALDFRRSGSAWMVYYIHESSMGRLSFSIKRSWLPAFHQQSLLLLSEGVSSFPGAQTLLILGVRLPTNVTLLASQLRYVHFHEGVWSGWSAQSITEFSSCVFYV